MNFKCYRIMRAIESPLSVTLPYEISGTLIKEVQTFDSKYDVFRISVNREAEKFGVRDDQNKEKNLKNELGSKELTTINFVFIDRSPSHNFVYFDGRKSDVISILQSLYQVKESDFEPDVSIQDLLYIQRLRITERSVGQMSFGDDEKIGYQHPDVNELFRAGTTPEKVVHDYEYSEVEGKKFIKDNLERYLDRVKASGLKKVSIEGKDRFGNIISYDEHFSRKLTILDDDHYLIWDTRDGLDLRKIKEEILTVELRSARGG